MASLAEVFIAAKHAVIFKAGMAVHTAGQTVFRATHALMNCLVALMLEIVHVNFAHYFWILDALPAFAYVKLRRWQFLRGEHGGGKEYREKNRSESNRHFHHSP